MHKQNNRTDSIKLKNLMPNDLTVSENYQRLVAQTLAGVYKTSNDDECVQELREELIGKAKSSTSEFLTTRY
ncbi:MAG: hypothetical protein U5Q03_07845 [Bacteroidota bacterium]|nr:hypothetical protein [Bacteroidota bacterium]